MIKVVNVQAHDDYSLLLTFNDGITGKVCLKDRLFGVMFEPLNNINYFKKVSVDEFGVVCWPNNADLDSSVLYEKLSVKK